MCGLVDIDNEGILTASLNILTTLLPSAADAKNISILLDVANLKDFPAISGSLSILLATHITGILGRNDRSSLYQLAKFL